MPGLSQLKKFNADILSLGNEPALRASRGEKPVVVPVPKDLKDINDSDDFLMGMPEPVENTESAKKSESIPEDFSDIMGTESSSAEQKSSDPADAPQINLSVPDISSIISGDNGISEPDLSMFEEPVQQAPHQDEKEPEPEKEPEIADLSLEDLLGGEGFDGTTGEEDFSGSNSNNSGDEIENLQDVEAVPDAEEISEPEPLFDSDFNGSFNSPTVKAAAEKSVDELIAEATGKAASDQKDENPPADAPSDDIENKIPPAGAGGAQKTDAPEELDVEENFKNSDFQDIDGLDLDSLDFSGDSENISDSETEKTSVPDHDAKPQEKSAENFDSDENFELPSEDFSMPELSSELESVPDSETDAAEKDADKDDAASQAETEPEFNAGSFDSVEPENNPEADKNNPETDKIAESEKLADSFGSDFDFSFPEGDDGISIGDENSDGDFNFDGNAIDMGEGLPDSITENDSAPKPEEKENPEQSDSFEAEDFPSDFNFDLNDTDSDTENSGDGFQESAPTEKFDTSEMDGLDFGIPDTDSALEKGNFELGNSNDFSSETGDFEIPGFSDVQTVEVNKNGKFKVADAEKPEEKTDGELPPNTLSDDQYKKFLKNLSSYPLNVRMAVEELIVKNEFTDEAEFEIIQKVLKKVSARQLASELEKMLDVAIPVPRDFERRTAEEYEAYKASFQYQLSNKIIPGAIISFAALIVCFFMFQFAKYFIYRPVRASSLYSQGYKLLESENFPQSETKFSEATKYQLIKKWFFKYAHGYREHKQFIRAEQMYRNILYCFDFDKTAGLEFAEMEYKDLANYEKAEQILLRDVLDHHINDADGILMLGDNYLEWAEEKNPEKYDEALKRYAELVQLYGPTDKYMARMLRYYIRTDNLKDVLNLKERFYPRPKSLEGSDWTELSGYCLDKLYGNLAPSDEYLRTKIEDVKKMLVRAVQSDGSNPVAYYNLGLYYIHTNNSENAEKTLLRSISFFEKADVVKKKDCYRNIDSYRLLGEIYMNDKEYLKAMESFTDGITLFTNANVSSGLEGNRNVGNLYADMGDIEYFISGNYDNALQNYQDAVNADYDNGKIRYKIGYIQYSKKNYSEAVGSFMKTAEDYADDQSLLLAMGNTLSLRNDNFAAEGYYERILDQIDSYREQHGVIFPQARKDENELVETYLKASNNLGVTLYRLAKRTGSSSMNAKSMVKLQESMRAWDALTRNQKTMVRLGGSNLAEQNLKYVTNPMPDYEPAIYTELPRTLTAEKGLSQ